MQLYFKFYSAGNHFLFISMRSFVRIAVSNVKLTFIGHFSSNCSVFYLYRATCAGSRSNPSLCTCVSIEVYCLVYGIICKRSCTKKCQYCQLCVLRPSWHSSVGPGFEPNQCLLTGTWKRLAQLAAKRSAGVTPEANIGECVIHMPLWL